MIDYRNPISRERVAIHEAGHAVVAAYSPLVPPVEQVTLNTGGGGLTALALESVKSALRATEDDPEALGDLFGHAIRTVAAGHLAESIAFDSFAPEASDSDFPKMVVLVQVLARVRVDQLLASDRGAAPKPEEAFAWARERARGELYVAEFLLRSCWGAVVNVADRLLELGTMPGYLLHTLIETAPEKTKPLPSIEHELELARRAESADPALRGLHERMRMRIEATEVEHGLMLLRALDAWKPRAPLQFAKAVAAL